MLIAPSTDSLIDPFGRTIDYIRISVTDRCDLRCNYCMPVEFSDYEEPKNWLSLKEIEKAVKVFTDLGVKHIRFTGGEPLLRKDLSACIDNIAQLAGISSIALSTNGTQLVKHVVQLKQAGLKRLNVSLDSLSPSRFAAICGSNALGKVLDGLELAKQVGFDEIKINTVLMSDTTDEEIDSLVEYCSNQGFILRLIEVMPIGDTGRRTGSTDLTSIKARLKSSFDLIDSAGGGPGPARYMVSKKSNLKIGFISPMSDHFCSSCNRIRMSVDGILYLCLGQNHSFNLGALLKRGASDFELKSAIYEAIALKPERHEFNELPNKIVRIMARTGG